MPYLLLKWSVYLLIFLIAPSKIAGQYSAATQEVLDAPIFFTFRDPSEGLTKEQIWQACKETTGVDRFKPLFLKGAFHSSIKSDSAIIYFEEARSYGEKMNIDFSFLRLIDFRIAEIYVYSGKIRLAELCLYKIISRTSESDYIHWLARIKKAKLFPNKKEIDALQKAASKKFNHELNDEQKINLLIQFPTLLHRENKLRFYREHNEFILKTNDPFKSFLFTYGSIPYIRSFSNDKDELGLAIKSVKNFYSRLSKKDRYFNSKFQYLLSEEHAFEGDYLSAHKAAALACLTLGIDTSINFDVNSMSISQFAAIDFLSNLALTKLYLGPDGVREAFEIYYRLADQYLISQSTHLTGWDIAGQHLLEKKILVPKILYIANYLYSETGDRSYLNRALGMVDASRGATLYSQLFRRASIRNGGGLSELLTIDRELSQKEYQLSQEEDDGTLLDRMIAIQEERQRVMNNILTEYPDYLEQRSMVSEDFIGEQQAYLAQSGGSLLYFLHHSNFSFRVLINSDSVKIDNLYHRVLDKNELPQLLAAYPECVDSSPGIDGQFSEECKETGYALYQQLFGGVEDLLQDEVLIIGDGPFTNFPFSSLPLDEDGTDYVGTRYQLTYNVSARLQRMMEGQRINPTYHQLLAFSPADGGSNVFASERGEQNLSSLKNTAAELDAIEAILPGAYFRGKAATRENLLARIADYEAIHLASHARADPDDGRLSYLVLNQEESGFSTPLYAAELADQELNAELVVLSACETGSGSDHLSEGTLGLTHAFTAAGARSVISSRWSVDDAATAELMGYFYHHLRNGLKKDESLWQAQQDYRLQHQGTYRDHPYYWSAFILSGDTGPVAFQSSVGSFIVNWLLAGLALLLVGGLAWRSKRVA